ncbi:MAG: hypothetical protein ACK5DD_08235 [Cyclobacteriaceae bacterium]|jgi:hypothetical protein
METKILIHTDQRGIDFLGQTARENERLLNGIMEFAPELKTEEAILAASTNVKDFILKKLFERFPQAAQQAQFSMVQFAYPNDLEQLRSLLGRVNARSFDLVVVDKKSKKWIVDREDFENKCDRYRTYATTPEEIKLWQIATTLCAELNSLGIGSEARKKFTNPLVCIQPRPDGQGYQLAPDWRGLRMSYTY